MKAVQVGPPEKNIWTVEIEEGDITGCPEWCTQNHVGEHIASGEAITHQAQVEYDLSLTKSADEERQRGTGEGAFVHIWQHEDDLSLHVCDSLGRELVECLTPIGAWTMAYALREAALRAYPFIQMHDDDMMQFAYKAPKVGYGYGNQAQVRKAVAPKQEEPPAEGPRAVKAA